MYFKLLYVTYFAILNIFKPALVWETGLQLARMRVSIPLTHPTDAEPIDQ